MKQFKDESGVDWTIRVTVATFERIKAQAGLDLLDADGGKIAQVGNDPYAFAQILFATCHAEAKERSIDYEAFTDRLAGDALQRAIDAFTEEYISFFPNPRRREVIRTALARQRAGEERILEAGQTNVARAVDQAVEKALAELSGNSPASSASTPATTPPAS